MKFKKTMKLFLPMILGTMVIASCSNDDDATMPPTVGQNFNFRKLVLPRLHIGSEIYHFHKFLVFSYQFFH